MSTKNIFSNFFYLLEPDYSRPLYKVPDEIKKKIIDKLAFLYGPKAAKEWYPEVERLMKVHYAHKSPELIEWEQNFDPRNRFTENDAILITYGDIIQNKDKRPLQTLAEFCKGHLKSAFNTLHILPFFPYSSDRGFAIKDFEEVDPRLGNWEDIHAIKSDFKLMFDGVFNHISSKSKWFQECLNGNPDYENFFIAFSTTEKISEDHLKLILRPRTTPLFTKFNTLKGKKLFWTTFSPDQIDLNYKNPKVLMKMIDILLFYVRKGADIIRLDAATYLWVELGTECAHLKQTHEIIKLFRVILDAVAPPVSLITETNVPHEQNIQYFGNGYDEAQMVYNFALPALVLYTFQTENAKKLTEWASTLKKVSDCATYFNFLDSHDGIGVLPVKGILTDEEIEMMALRVLEHGGLISFRSNPDGTYSPYELNITWYSAINKAGADESQDLQIKRFLASRAIALVFMGVPGVYIHSLFGSKNDAEAVLVEKHPRSINRKVVKEDFLKKALNDYNSTTYKVSKELSELLNKRRTKKVFHPNAEQKVLDLSEAVFSVVRISVDKKEALLAVINIKNDTVDLQIPYQKIGFKASKWEDILSGKKIEGDKEFIQLTLEPYDIFWLETKL